MIRSDEVYRIGRLGKTHGVKGELTFMFDDDVFDRADADYIILETEGILVPFFIEEYRFRSDSTAIIKLEDVDTQERARQYVNCEVYFPHSITPEADGEEMPSWASIVGYSLIDAETGRSVGRIADVDTQTCNTLFCLEDGRLIPASEQLITGIDTKAKTITTQLPQGILDI